MVEARGNAEAALIRAVQMCVTIGQAAGLPEFAGLGTYAEGALDFAFAEREVFPVSDLEEHEGRKVQLEGAALEHELGTSRWTLLTELGRDPAFEAKKRQDEAEADQELGAQLMTEFQAGVTRDQKLAGFGQEADGEADDDDEPA